MSWLAVESLEAGYGTGYGKRQVLFDASIQLEKGEIALVVGPNGSGKSTLLRAIFRQCDVYDAKSFCYKNLQLRTAPLRLLLQSGLAYVPQYKNVFDRLTVRENLVLTTTIRGQKNCLDQILLDIPELKGMLGKAAGQLSGGQRQILALAMGLSVHPELLLLDEPLAGLDERSTGRVAKIVQHYRERHGMAFVIVEHRFTKLTDLADKCYGMKLGNTVASLNASQLRDKVKFEAEMRRVFFS